MASLPSDLRADVKAGDIGADEMTSDAYSSHSMSLALSEWLQRCATRLQERPAAKQSGRQESGAESGVRDPKVLPRGPRL